MKQIGRYEIRKESGRGGMSTVYEAFDPHFRRAVAVKVMTRELLDDPKLVARFEREAQTIATLEHPAIVPVYDFGEDERRPFLVMRLMTGGTLADRLKGGPLSVSETAKILNRIGSALERAHQQGVIHRDLKPSNIMFDQYGDAFLADFGIARLTEGAVTLTGENVIGTPAYMSPEQIHGDQTIDGRSDIYALGVICFEMLTGQRPFQEKSPAKLMMQHIIDPVPDIREVRPDLPVGVEAIMARSMAKSPEERYTNAGELTDTLDSLAKIDAVAPAAGQDAGVGKVAAAAASVQADEMASQAKMEVDASEVTIPDSGEMVGQPPAPEATLPPTPAPEPVVEAEAVGKIGRRKWIVIGAIALGVLLSVILAVVYGGDIFAPGGDEAAEINDAPIEAAVIGTEVEEAARPEEEDGSRDTPVPDPRPAAEALMERFYVAMDAQEYDTAEDAIRQAITLLPEEAWLHGEMAWYMEATGDFEGALAAMGRAIKLDPENGGYFAARGNIFRELGNLEAALANHLQAIELSPDDPYPLMELAETYKQLDDLGAALEHYNQALAIKEDEGWLYGARADVYFLLGDYDMALADLERASEIEPEEQGYFTRAGDMLLFEAQDPERALAYYTLAVERFPDEGWVYNERVNAHEALGNIDAALADLERAIELDPQNGHFYIRRAQFFLNQLEDIDAARADLERAVEVDPENPDAFAERASFFQYHAGDLEAALEDRSRALALEPEGPWRYADRAEIYRELGRHDEAMGDLAQCLDLDPGYYWCAWERAWVFDDLEQKRKAVADFRRFLDLAPEDECPECREEAEQYIRENSQ
jgi:serine/threonine-protein kinase